VPWTESAARIQGLRRVGTDELRYCKGRQAVRAHWRPSSGYAHLSAGEKREIARLRVESLGGGRGDNNGATNRLIRACRGEA